jgi:hypothetical protein
LVDENANTFAVSNVLEPKEEKFTSPLSTKPVADTGESLDLFSSLEAPIVSHTTANLNRSVDLNPLLAHPRDSSGLKHSGKSSLYFDQRNQIAGFSVKGINLGDFGQSDHVLVIYNDGSYITYLAADQLEVGDGIMHIGKWQPTQVFTVCYTDSNTGDVYAKRFQIATITQGKYFHFVPDEEDTKIHFFSIENTPMIEIKWKGEKSSEKQTLHDAFCPITKLSQPGILLGHKLVDQILLTRASQMELL